MEVMKKAGQYQVIIGNNVADCYKEITKRGNLQDKNTEQKEETNGKKQNLIMRVLDVISGCMSSLMPAIIGAGMVKVLVVLLGFVLPETSQTLKILTVMGDCAYYFMPILLAFTAGKKFGTNPMLVAAVAGVLLHPDFIALLAAGDVKFLGVPVITTSYSSTVIPILLTAWAMLYIDKLVDKITPSVTKNFLKPFLILLISAPVAFIILGPLGGVVGNGLAAVALKSKNSGLKQVASASGFSALLAGITEPAMYGVTLKLKKPMWAACIASGITGIFIGAVGLSAHAFATPAIVAMPQFIGGGSNRNLIYACIAAVAVVLLSFILTWVIGFEDPKEETKDSSPNEIQKQNKQNSEIKPTTEIKQMSVTDQGQDSGQCEAINQGQDKEQCEAANQEEDQNRVSGTDLFDRKDETFSNTQGIEIASVLSSAAVPLSMVDDATFAEEILGKGVAVIPSEGKVFAPFDGEVSTIFDTKHAIGLISEDGIELLVHVGLDTVTLGGKYFTAHVENGQKIKKGELMLEFDIEAIRDAGFDVITPVLLTNSDEYKEIVTKKGWRVEAGETLIKVVK